jgi:hypothetical protein
MAKKQAAPPAKKPAASKTPPPPNRRSAREAQEESGAGQNGQSRADAFDAAKPQGQIDGGKYVALIAEMVLQDPDDKGQSARVKYEIATEGEFRGADVTQFYKLFEADGSVGKGAAFLKRDLAVLGHADVKFGDLEETFEEIVNDQVGCNVTVKQNGQWTNVYLDGVTEDTSVIDEYLQVRAF